MWLVLSDTIYSRIALSFALNLIFFSANENGTAKQNNQSDLKFFLTNQSHCRKMKDKKKKKKHCVANIWRFQNGSNKVAIELRVVQFGLKSYEYDFRPNCTPLSSITIINTRVENQHHDREIFIGAIKKKKITQHNTADPTALIRYPACELRNGSWQSDRTASKNVTIYNLFCLLDSVLEKPNN